MLLKVQTWTKLFKSEYWENVTLYSQQRQKSCSQNLNELNVQH